MVYFKAISACKRKYTFIDTFLYYLCTVNLTFKDKLYIYIYQATECSLSFGIHGDTSWKEVASFTGETRLRLHWMTNKYANGYSGNFKCRAS